MRKNILRSLTYFLFFTASISGMVNGEPDPALVKKYTEMMDGERNLNLSDKNLGDKDAIAIGEALKVNKTLEFLHLNTQIGDTGAKAIAGALQFNNSLTNLGIMRRSTINYIPVEPIKLGDESAKAFAEALKVNKGLQTLTLNITLGVEGANAFAEAIKANKPLKYLQLFGTKINDDGIIAIAQALKFNKSLIYLQLSDSQKLRSEGEKASQEIEKQIKINENLQNILRVNWSKIKQVFAGYQDADSVFYTLPKEVILKILENVIDLETISAKK